jgi:hypothetical protein
MADIQPNKGGANIENGRRNGKSTNRRLSKRKQDPDQVHRLLSLANAKLSLFTAPDEIAWAAI